MELYYTVTVTKNIICKNADEMYKIVKEMESHINNSYYEISEIKRNCDEYGEFLGTYTIILQTCCMAKKDRILDMCKDCLEDLP